jgi:uncharacterized membrane protein YvbJ
MKPRAKARYFCESCGAEVHAGASTCPSCGSVFTAVRCPECGYEGRAPEFRSGCPVCGYRARSMGSAAADPADSGPAKRGLPPAFYRAAVIVLGVLIIGLIIVLVLQA